MTDRRICNKWIMDLSSKSMQVGLVLLIMCNSINYLHDRTCQNFLSHLETYHRLNVLDLSEASVLLDDTTFRHVLQIQSPGTLQLVKLLCVVRPCL